MSVRQLITGKSDGPGSGNRWRYGAKSTTDDFRTLDVRRWAREGVLKPGYGVGCQWTRDGETVASIQMRAEQDRVILIYRHRSGDGEWKDEHYAVRIVRTVQPRRFPRLVHLPGRRLWAARGDPLRRRHLRLSALLSARLCQFTRGRGRPRNKACAKGQEPWRGCVLRNAKLFALCIDVGGPSNIGWADAEGQDGTGANFDEALTD